MEVKLYKRRWIFLAFLSLLEILSGFSYTSVGQISNFFVYYFKTSYSAVVWLTVACDVSPLVTTIPLTWLIHKKLIGFRKLVIFCAGSLVVGYTCFTISTLNHEFYAFAVMGQLINGFSVLMVVSPAIFAASWFPEDQVGTAISITAASINSGALMGLVLPVSVLPLDFHARNGSFSEVDHQKINDGRHSLRVIYCICASLACVVFIFMFIFLTDKPPSPPTFAQSPSCPSKLNKKANGYWEETRVIFTNKTFVLLCVVYAVVIFEPTIEFTAMSQIIRSFPRNSTGSYDAMSAYVVLFYSLFSAFGSLLGGRMVNFCKNYKALGVAFSAGLFLASVGVTFSVYFTNYVALCATIAVFGLSTKMISVLSFDFVTQTTYPVQESFVVIWYNGVTQPFGVVFGTLGDAIYRSLGGTAVMVFQSGCTFVVFVVCLLLSNDNKRLNEAKLEDTDYNSNERSKLVQK